MPFLFSPLIKDDEKVGPIVLSLFVAFVFKFLGERIIIEDELLLLLSFVVEIVVALLIICCGLEVTIILYYFFCCVGELHVIITSSLYAL